MNCLRRSKFVAKCRPVAIFLILGNFDNILVRKCCHSEPLFENLPTFSSPETTFDEFRHLFVVCFAKNRSFWQQVSQRRQTFYPIGIHTLQSQLFSTPFASLHIPKEPARLSPTGSSFNRYILFVLTNRLFDDFCYYPGAYCSSTFSDCESQSFFDCYRCDQFDFHCNVISRHTHFYAFR